MRGPYAVPDGRNGTLEQSSTEDGTHYRWTRTGPAGQAWTSEGTTSGDAYQYRRAFTGPQGQTHQYQQTWDGQAWTAERTMTGPNGQTRTWQQTVSGDDVSVARSFTGPNGQTRTWQRAADGQVTVDRTGPQTPVRGPETRPTVPPRRSGFTLGASSHARSGWGQHRGAEPRAGQITQPGERARVEQFQQRQRLQHDPPGLSRGGRK